MSEAGRKRWWRAALVAVVGGGTVLGGWAGLSRSAPSDPSAPPAVPAKPADQNWARSSPPAPAPAPAAPVGDVVPAIPVAPSLPSIPAIPVAPEVTPAALPAIPAAPPDLPALPALPGTEEKKPVVPLVAPPAPVLLPPSIDKRPTSPDAAPAPSPAKTARPGELTDSGKPDSRLQGPNTGNSVKTENSGSRPGLVAPPVPIAPPVVDPVVPVLPALPAAGSPGEASGTTVDLAKPGERSLPTPGQASSPSVTPPTPGDTTVRILNESIAAAVVGGMLYVPASAAPPIPLTVPLPLQIQDKTEIAELKTKVEAANTKLTEIQRDLKNLTELLNGRRDKDGFPIETSPGLIAELKKLTDRLATVETDLNKMKGQTSLRPGSTGGTTPSATVDPRAGKGTVRVVNEYPVQISIVVNGTSYRVAPTKTLDVDVPAGEFSYQLLESGAASTKSSIKEKETVTLRIK